MSESYGFDTLCLHGRHEVDRATGSRAVPIHQTTSYLFDGVDHAARLFDLAEAGHIYTRISNPTTGVLEQRLALLANIGDARTLVIHPATTTHRQLSAAERRAAGVPDDLVRLSVVLEDLGDITADLAQALEAA